MYEGLSTLTEREKETLRFLLGAHDAKSIARAQGLSVHTVNERLRAARRKLDVTSSREAARLLAEAESPGPDPLVDKVFGVAGGAADLRMHVRPDGRRIASDRLLWLGGGMLIMSLILLAITIPFTASGDGATDLQRASRPALASAPAQVPETQATRSARRWVALLDGRRWEESWRQAAALFKSQIEATRWASTIKTVRQPLGDVSSRTLRSATRTGSLPGAPAGEYEVIEFDTDFAGKGRSVETVVLAREPSGWKVAGYFIR